MAIIDSIKSDIQKAHKSNTPKSWKSMYQVIKRSNICKKEVNKIMENLFPNIKFKISQNRLLIDFLNPKNLQNFSKLCRTLTEINNKKNNPSKCKKLKNSKKYKDTYRWEFSYRGRVIEVRNNNISTIEDITYTHKCAAIGMED